MSKQAIIERTVKIINQLPESKAEEISDFAGFVIKRYEEQALTEDIKNMVSDSQAFEFLSKEEEIYSEKDLKIMYSE
jgi:anion-transporting  ArsA/GET3 family ATPase